jgi:hypothetical protein
MDPITEGLVKIIAMGALAGLKDSAQQSVRDAYSSVKSYIRRRYGDSGVDLVQVERKPQSLAKQKSLQEDLDEVSAAQDDTLRSLVNELAEVVRNEDPETFRAFHGTRAVSLINFEVHGDATFSEISAEGADTHAVSAENVRVGGNVTFNDIHARSDNDDPN